MRQAHQNGQRELARDHRGHRDRHDPHELPAGPAPQPLSQRAWNRLPCGSGDLRRCQRHVRPGLPEIFGSVKQLYITGTRGGSGHRPPGRRVLPVITSRHARCSASASAAAMVFAPLHCAIGQVRYKSTTARNGKGRSKIMKILVLGGDGYLGWPTALHLSEVGHDVAVADNFSRRGYDYEIGVESLVPIESLQTRIRAWRELTGKDIGYYIGDLCDPGVTYKIVRAFGPEAIVHFAEQRAAPYSMVDRKHAVYTQTNDVVGNLY